MATSREQLLEAIIAQTQADINSLQNYLVALQSIKQQQTTQKPVVADAYSYQGFPVGKPLQTPQEIQKSYQEDAFPEPLTDDCWEDGFLPQEKFTPVLNPDLWKRIEACGIRTSLNNRSVWNQPCPRDGKQWDIIVNRVLKYSNSAAFFEDYGLTRDYVIQHGLTRLQADLVQKMSIYMYNGGKP